MLQPMFGMGVVAVVRDKNTGEVLSTRVMHKRGSDPPYVIDPPDTPREILGNWTLGRIPPEHPLRLPDDQQLEWHFFGRDAEMFAKRRRPPSMTWAEVQSRVIEPTTEGLRPPQKQKRANPQPGRPVGDGSAKKRGRPRNTK